MAAQSEAYHWCGVCDAWISVHVEHVTHASLRPPPMGIQVLLLVNPDPDQDRVTVDELRRAIDQGRTT